MTLGFLPVMVTHQQLIRISTTTVSFMATTSDYELNTFHQNKADIDSHIRLFWDDFPCPPPWRPSILTEVNISKLGPQIGQSVKKFLVGKCRLQSVFPAIQLDPEWSEDEFRIPDSMGGRGDTHATSTSSSPDQAWCGQTCQLVIGFSGVFVAIVIVLIAIVCFHRSRRSQKMPSTRPSRQQLQMSTSTSDPINWAEFSNTQVQFDDDNMIYPPFRHRDLPSPPSQCHHPSCDPKWTCANGSSFHPLMRVSPASTTYCTRGYTAVYEKIDDEDDEYYDDRVPCNLPRLYRRGERTMNIPQIGYRPSNGVPFIPESHATAALYREEETVFNGDNFPVSVLPRYFELQDTHHSPNTHSPTYKDQMDVANNATRENDSSVNTRTMNNSRCNAFQQHSAFLGNHNNMCNQLCATCVSNVVSMNSPPSCIKNHNQGQQETVSNVNSFNNMNPISTTANGVSTHTHISGYHPPNTSSFRQFSDIPPPLDDSVTEVNPPPYTDLGCDLRYRNGSTLDCPPLYENENKDGRSLFTDLTQTQPAKHVTGNHSRRCHVMHNGSPFGSPCREWCPSCQQVPLLNGNNSPEDPHSASSAWPKTPNINTPSQHVKIMSGKTRSSNDKTLNEDKELDNVDNILVDLKEENGAVRNGDVNLTCPHSQMYQADGRNRVDETRGERTLHEGHIIDENMYHQQGHEDEMCDDESARHALSLHSHYFNKSS